MQLIRQSHRDFRAGAWARAEGLMRRVMPDLLAGLGMAAMLVLIVMVGGLAG